MEKTELYFANVPFGVSRDDMARRLREIGCTAEQIRLTTATHSAPGHAVVEFSDDCVAMRALRVLDGAPVLLGTAPVRVELVKNRRQGFSNERGESRGSDFERGWNPPREMGNRSGDFDRRDQQFDRRDQPRNRPDYGGENSNDRTKRFDSERDRFENFPRREHVSPNRNSFRGNSPGAINRPFLDRPVDQWGRENAFHERGGPNRPPRPPQPPFNVDVAPQSGIRPPTSAGFRPAAPVDRPGNHEARARYSPERETRFSQPQHPSYSGERRNAFSPDRNSKPNYMNAPHSAASSGRQQSPHNAHESGSKRFASSAETAQFGGPTSGPGVSSQASSRDERLVGSGPLDPQRQSAELFLSRSGSRSSSPSRPVSSYPGPVDHSLKQGPAAFPGSAEIRGPRPEFSRFSAPNTSKEIRPPQPEYSRFTAPHGPPDFRTPSDFRGRPEFHGPPELSGPPDFRGPHEFHGPRPDFRFPGNVRMPAEIRGARPDIRPSAPGRPFEIYDQRPSFSRPSAPSGTPEFRSGAPHPDHAKPPGSHGPHDIHAAREANFEGPPSHGWQPDARGFKPDFNRPPRWPIDNSGPRMNFSATERGPRNFAPPSGSWPQIPPDLRSSDGAPGAPHGPPMSSHGPPGQHMPLQKNIVRTPTSNTDSRAPPPFEAFSSEGQMNSTFSANRPPWNPPSQSGPPPGVHEPRFPSHDPRFPGQTFHEEAPRGGKIPNLSSSFVKAQENASYPMPRFPNDHDSMPRFPGGHDPMLRFPSDHDSMPRFPGGHDPMPRFPGGHDPMPRFPGGHDPMPRFPGGHDHFRPEFAGRMPVDHAPHSMTGDPSNQFRPPFGPPINPFDNSGNGETRNVNYMQKPEMPTPPWGMPPPMPHERFPPPGFPLNQSNQFPPPPFSSGQDYSQIGKPAEKSFDDFYNMKFNDPSSNVGPPGMPPPQFPGHFPPHSGHPPSEFPPPTESGESGPPGSLAKRRSSGKKSEKDRSGHKRKGHHHQSVKKMSSSQRRKSGNVEVDINADIRKRYEAEKQPLGFCSYDVSYGGMLTEDLITPETQSDKSRGPPKLKRPRNGSASPGPSGQPPGGGPGGPFLMRRGGPEDYFNRMNPGGPGGMMIPPEGTDFASMDYQDLLQDYLTTRGISHSQPSTKKPHGSSGKRRHSTSKRSHSKTGHAGSVSKSGHGKTRSGHGGSSKKGHGSAKKSREHRKHGSHKRKKTSPGLDEKPVEQ